MILVKAVFNTQDQILFYHGYSYPSFVEIRHIKFICFHWRIEKKVIELAKKVKKRFLAKCWIKQGGCITWYKCRTYWVYCGMQFKILGGGINGRPVVCGFGNLDHSGILTYYICIMWQNKSKHLFKTIWTWCLQAFFLFHSEILSHAYYSPVQCAIPQ